MLSLPQYLGRAGAERHLKTMFAAVSSQESVIWVKKWRLSTGLLQNGISFA
jgi:hypothetical protein